MGGVFFFFSSRRRHTRWPRDWSSDVCSSDLRCSGRECSHPGQVWQSCCHQEQTEHDQPLGDGRRDRALTTREPPGGQQCTDQGGGQESNGRSEEHTSELQSRGHLVCRLLLEKKNKKFK